MPSRHRGKRKTIDVVSPYKDPFTATIARATNREDVERTNMFSKMRQIQNTGTPDEIVIERDFAMGDIQIATIILCLEKWDIADDTGRVYEVSEDNLLDLITGQERRWLYEEIMDFNPIWKGEEEEKEESDES
jgi:hypothetical protein